MPVLTHPLPDVTAANASEILATHWGIHGILRPLPGERERNFHVYTADGREFVLKVASPLEDAGAIDLQVAALAHIADKLPSAPVPRLVPSIEGSRVVHQVIGGELHAARLLTWLPGQPLAEVSPHSPALLRAVGASLGAVTGGLASFDHPAARRGLKWDLAASDWIADHIHRVADGSRRAEVETILTRFTRDVRPALATTRSSVVHNDANDYNILVALNGDGALAPSGLIDFGD
ncbi:MAG TPA: phosphotransferase, partial [Gemmatimonadaceae bacterium]|nr:phosphotransferase [Gemmatimonadaceae bacterium]